MLKDAAVNNQAKKMTSIFILIEKKILDLDVVLIYLSFLLDWSKSWKLFAILDTKKMILTSEEVADNSWILLIISYFQISTSSILYTIY